MENNSVTQMLVLGQKDLEWFESNLNGLKSKFNNKFVAFHNAKVIDSDSDLDSLMEKLKNRNIDLSNVFVKFISKVKYIL